MSEQRRLVAMLVANVVCSSRLMGSDESGALSRLHAYLCRFTALGSWPELTDK